MSVMRFDHEALSWWLFLVCALFFVVGSIRAGDPVFLGGSMLFLVACVVYLVGRRRWCPRPRSRIRP